MQNLHRDTPPAAAFWVILAAGVSVALHIGKLPPAVAALRQQLGISLVQAGFLLSAVQLAGMCLGLAIGLGAERWGLKRGMVAGLVLMGLASIAGSGATELTHMLDTATRNSSALKIGTRPEPKQNRNVPR